MKKLILNLIIVFAAVPMIHAQSFEFAIGANTGMFAYHGPGTTSAAEIIGSSSQSSYNLSYNYTNNPYVSKYALSYGVSLQPQFVFKSGFMVGLQGSYDVLRGTAPVTGVFPTDVAYAPTYYGTTTQAANGNVTLRAKEISINPYIGYRLTAGNVKLDVMPGVSLGFDLNNREKGKGTIESSHANYPVNYLIEKYPADVQLKLGIGASWHRWGLSGSYAYGLTDLEPRHEAVPVALDTGSAANYYAAGKIHSSLFRLGISYTLFTVKPK